MRGALWEGIGAPGKVIKASWRVCIYYRRRQSSPCTQGEELTRTGGGENRQLSLESTGVYALRLRALRMAEMSAKRRW